MTCVRIDERLARLTASDPVPEFTAEELGHIGSCARCRELAAETAGAFLRIARASAEHRPDPAYWASLLPRIRERARRRESRAAWPVTPAVTVAPQGDRWSSVASTVPNPLL